MSRLLSFHLLWQPLPSPPGCGQRDMNFEVRTSDTLNIGQEHADVGGESLLEAPPRSLILVVFSQRICFEWG